MDDRGLLVFIDHRSAIRPVIPATRRPLVLQHFHDSFVGGHRGRDKTIERLERRYFWTSMRRDVNAYVESCDACQRRKSPTHARTSAHRPFRPIISRRRSSLSTSSARYLQRLDTVCAGRPVQQASDDLPDRRPARAFRGHCRRRGEVRASKRQQDPRETDSRNTLSMRTVATVGARWSAIGKIIGCLLNWSTRTDSIEERAEDLDGELPEPHYHRAQPRELVRPGRC